MLRVGLGETMNAINSKMSGTRDAESHLTPGCKMRNPLARRWDDYEAYLFDIDGTLLHCQDAVHYFSFLFALNLLSGRALGLEGVTTHGNTDPGILRDALTMAGVPDSTWRPRIAEAFSGMCGFVKERCDELNPKVLPGTRIVLQHLRERGALLGVATGNLQAIGRLKLEKSALLDYFELGAFSDSFEDREQVFRHGMSRVRSILGENATICVFGDTPADIQAAHACGVDVIAVATGVHSLEELVAEGPNLCLSSMRDLVAERVDADCNKGRRCSQTE